MLSYLALVFGSELMGSTAGHIFMQTMNVVVGLILLSAVNTAMNGLISLQYLMASDDELPPAFRKVNKYGVPLVPLIVVSLIPAFLVLSIQKLVLLADLYAVGFVGAIAVNLGATSTDFKLPLSKKERVFMFGVCLIMSAIEITLFIQKPHARYFVLAIMVFGLGLRWLSKELKKRRAPVVPAEPAVVSEEKAGATLCLVKRFGKAIRMAVEESNQKKTTLNIIILREQRVISDRDLRRIASKDPIARKIIHYINEYGDLNLIQWEYHVTDSFADIAVAYAMKLEASRIIIDAPRSRALTLIRGNYIKKIRYHLPESVTLITR